MMASIFMSRKGYPSLMGEGILQTFGIEDCRVSLLEDHLLSHFYRSVCKMALVLVYELPLTGSIFIRME